MITVIRRIDKMNYLIRSKRTGTPIQFAEKLEISESTLYQHLNDLRELGAPIAYDKFRQTYYYETCGEIKIHFEKVHDKNI
jgi:predicted DNA-binding transcriptional regulator YafY